VPDGPGHRVDPGDEYRHPVGPEPLWGESYYLDFVSDGTGDDAVAGYVRIGLYPNLGVTWWTTMIVGPDRPMVASVSYDLPVIEGPGLALRAEGYKFDGVVGEPLRAMRVHGHVPGSAHDHPAAVYRGEAGRPTPLDLDLTWTTDGTPYHYDVTTRYEIPCIVSGTVTIGGETFAVDGQGQRDHSWGVRDWWAFGWCWNSMRLDDGTRVHDVDIRFDGFQAFFGYVQTPDQRAAGISHTLTALKVSEELGEHGFPTTARIELTAGLNGAGEPASPPVHDLGLDVTPVAFGPVLLRNQQDGRVSLFPRAMVRCRSDDGRTGAGWIEWNQPQSPSPT
jgi:hypothetical protein